MNTNGNSHSGSPSRGSQSGRPVGGSRGSPSRSRSGSQSGGTGFPKPLGYDPAKPLGTSADDKGNKRLDLPPDAYASPARLQNAGVQGFAKRPGYNSSGRLVTLDANQFSATSFSKTVKVYQYDVAISPATKSPAVMFRKCMEHEDTKQLLSKYKAPWIHDGHKLMWSNSAIKNNEERFIIDLDKNVPPRTDGKPRRENKFHVTIRQTSTINLFILDAYLRGQAPWDNKVLECMNFLDHVIRQGPSEKLIPIKRSFYPQIPDANKRIQLSPIVELIKGVYASIRMNQGVMDGHGVGLGINVDVANTAFWAGGQTMINFIKQYLWIVDPKLRSLDLNALAQKLKPVRKDRTPDWVMSDTFKLLRKLEKLHFQVQHRGKEANTKDYRIYRFAFNKEFGAEGQTAKTFSFADHESGKQVNIGQYFQKKYDFRITNPDWPLIETARAGMFPVDCCTVKTHQRYPFKLDGETTAAMIKQTANRPEKRRAEIMEAKNLLDFDKDKYLKAFGITIDPNMSRIQARVLAPPIVQYQGSHAKPEYSGRWDLRGKKFWLPNPQALSSWGVMIMERSVQPAAAQAFANSFQQVYVSHGGQVKNPPVVVTSQAQEGNAATAIANGIAEVRAKTKQPVQILFCILRFNNSGNYERLKKSGDCRFGVLTQVVLSKHVEKNSSQYHSNVCMKVNSKLGGTSCRVSDPTKPPKAQPAPTFFQVPTMIIGADVSHAGAGLLSPSVAAMTMSMDRDACRYAAACQTNGYRVEMLTPANMHGFLNKLMPMWLKALGSGDPPRHIYYFRDGVSEGQFAQVLEQEVGEMKRFFREKFGSRVPKLTVIVATKRHHIRFFPHRGQGDKNGNTLPGTLVEKVVCHPFQWDFYLSSQSAIQGTARPVHYTVLVDEANVNPSMLQSMINQQCYQYARSTTPVSLHPAIYYADLACGRARAHESVATSDGFRTGPKAQENVEKYGYMATSMGGPPRGAEAEPLLSMGGKEATDINRDLINKTMWYI